jgi:hypothetical protein
MRLLSLNSCNELTLTSFPPKKKPHYAILSHTWGADSEEVNFKDIIDGTGYEKPGYKKILFCADQAHKDGLQYFWVDSYCIDKSNSAELSEAINSMFRWYKMAATCYVYLADVFVPNTEADTPDTITRSHAAGVSGSRFHPYIEGVSATKTLTLAFRKSRWFTRGWTLQELLAPSSVEFFSRESVRLGDKISMEKELHEITKIPVQALRSARLSEFTEKERISWASGRETLLEEDEIYSLFGILDVFLPPIYGEGRDHAMNRLRSEIDKRLKRDPKYQKALISSLWFDQINDRFNTIKPALAQTCTWLITNAKYTSWLDPSKLSEHNGFLWVKGKPGAGKSTLLKFALTQIQNLIIKHREDFYASFFFNARGSELERDVIGMYRSLLYQVLTEIPGTHSVLEDIQYLNLPENGASPWTAELLKGLLDRAIRKLGGRRLWIFVDALDECDEYQVR